MSGITEDRRKIAITKSFKRIAFDQSFGKFSTWQARNGHPIS